MISFVLTSATHLTAIQFNPTSIERTSCPTPVTLPMLRGDGQSPTIEMKIGGKPYRFTLDTGTEGGGRISPSVVAKLGLKPSGKIMVGDPSGKGSRQVSTYKIPEMVAGTAHFFGVSLFADAGPEGPGGGSKVDGVIGYGVFKDLLLILDYPSRQVVFKKGNLPATAMSYSLEHGTPILPITIGSFTMNGHVDSGSDGGIMIPTKYKKQLPLDGEPTVIAKAKTNFNTIEIYGAKVKGTVKIGGMPVPIQMIEMHDMFPFGNIGGMVLRNYKVSIDQKKLRVLFELPKV